MIECIFTLDYEIYGNGQGTLRDLVLEPSQRLAETFGEFEVPFVVFTEATEFAKMEEAQSDPDTGEIRAQLRQLRAAGHEIALHIHPWWANAKYQDGRWILDWSEQIIGKLQPSRVETIVSDAIEYLRETLNDSTFTPASFRAGSWAFQPCSVIAHTLARHGVLLDSSVFKGGRVRGMGLDYRPALRNGGSWRFSDDVNVPDALGLLVEMPIHTELVPFWRMLRRKRLKLQSKTRTASYGSPLPHYWRDFVRFRYPRKFDFCRMSFAEMCDAMEGAIKERARSQDTTPVVAIGHTKDFVDAKAVRRFLAFLQERGVGVTTFSRVLTPEPQLSF
jgi:hypothetical protein